jgi:proteasome assembly chaperone (PAC2) family protein
VARHFAKVSKIKGMGTLVLGLPNRGMVGVLCASYLLEKLEMKQVGEAAFYCLRPAVFTDDSGVTMRNTADVYKLGKAPGVGVLHCGDQPEGPDAWDMGHQMLEMARGWGVKRVVTAGAMPLPEEKAKKMASGKGMVERDCEVAASSPKMVKEAVKAGARACKGSNEMVIVGLEGFIPGIAPWYGMEGAILLSETPYFDIEPSLVPAAATHDVVAALSALRVMNAMLKLGLDLSDAEQRAKELDELQKKSLKQAGRDAQEVSTGHG